MCENLNPKMRYRQKTQQWGALPSALLDATQGDVGRAGI
jgi:hypothetical protein